MPKWKTKRILYIRKRNHPELIKKISQIHSSLPFQKMIETLRFIICYVMIEKFSFVPNNNSNNNNSKKANSETLFISDLVTLNAIDMLSTLYGCCDRVQALYKVVDDFIKLIEKKKKNE